MAIVPDDLILLKVGLAATSAACAVPAAPLQSTSAAAAATAAADRRGAGEPPHGRVTSAAFIQALLGCVGSLVVGGSGQQCAIASPMLGNQQQLFHHG
ncbi:hypothetical protein D3C81_1215570 [compost metagenome]